MHYTLLSAFGSCPFLTIPHLVIWNNAQQDDRLFARVLVNKIHVVLHYHEIKLKLSHKSLSDPTWFSQVQVNGTCLFENSLYLWGTKCDLLKMYRAEHCYRLWVNSVTKFALVQPNSQVPQYKVLQPCLYSSTHSSDSSFPNMNIVSSFSLHEANLELSVY